MQGCADISDPVSTHVASAVTRSDIRALYQVVRLDSNSFGKMHNAGLDSILVRIKEFRRTAGIEGPILSSDMCRIVNDFVKMRVEPLIVSRTEDKCKITKAAQRPTAAQLATAASWTPADWVDSLFLEPEPWDEGEFDGPSSEEYADATADAAQEVSDVLEVPTGTYAGMSEVEDAVIDVVAGLNPSSTELAEMMAEVAAYGIESGEYWVENGDDWFEAVCGEEPPQIAARGVSVASLEGLSTPRFRASWRMRGEVPAICENPPNARVATADHGDDSGWDNRVSRVTQQTP